MMSVGIHIFILFYYFFLFTCIRRQLSGFTRDSFVLQLQASKLPTVRRGEARISSCDLAYGSVLFTTRSECSRRAPLKSLYCPVSALDAHDSALHTPTSTPNLTPNSSDS